MSPRSRRPWRGSVLLLLLAGLAPRAQAQPAPAVPDARLQQRLSALYTRMLAGIRDRDTVALRAVLSPAYLYSPGDSGMVRTRSGRFQSIVSDTDTLDVLDLDQCTFGPGTATRVEAECLIHEVGTFDRERWDARVRSIVTFVREPRRGWLIASTHTWVMPGAKRLPAAP